LPKADVRRATKLSNFVTQLWCATKLPRQGNCQFSTGKQSPNRPLRYLATGKQPLQLTSLTT